MVGEEYFPLGHMQFNSVINKIKLKKPDVIYAIIVGGSNVAFYKQLKATGIDLTKQTLLTISVTEDEIRGIGGENITGAYAAMKCFQSLANPNNKAFVEAFKAKWGKDIVIGDVTQAAYLGPWLWKAAVEKAGSFDVDKVRAASTGIELQHRAGRPCPHPQEPSPVEQDPHRSRQGRWSVRAHLRDQGPDGARSLPQGLPITASGWGRKTASAFSRVRKNHWTAALGVFSSSLRRFFAR